MKNITIVILAAGKSSRFKNNTSKIFQDLGGLSIIEHVYQLAKKISKNRIVFVCNEENIGELKKKFIGCSFVIQKNQKGTADAILSAKKYLIDDAELVSEITRFLVPLNLISDFVNNSIALKNSGKSYIANSCSNLLSMSASARIFFKVDIVCNLFPGLTKIFLLISEKTQILSKSQGFSGNFDF